MPASIVYRSETAALVRGDCLADNLAPVLAEAFGEDARAQLVRMDPPYGIGHASADDAEAGDWDGAEHRLDYAAALARLRPLCHANATAFVFGPVGTFLDARSALPDASGWHALQDLVWEKMGAPRASGRADADAQRSFFPDTERVLFCEAASDPRADTPERDAERAWRLREEKEHDAKMAPLARYFADALAASGLTRSELADHWRKAFPGQSGAILSHYFSAHQFYLPPRAAYATLRRIVPDLRREWEDLRREWEDLRREWEDLRRPFFAPDGRTPSDLLQFPPVPIASRVHPCQKPVGLLSYLVEIATRPGDLVVDPFAGSGSTGVAALATGRRVLLVEREPSALAIALGRLGGASKSPYKRAASARNGVAGGRPRRVFRFPEFAPGFDRAYELRVGDEVVPISTGRPGEEPTWSLSRDPTILAHGVSLPGGRRHRGASVSAAGVATVAHGLHRVAAIEWTSRPLPRSMPADRREALGGRERVLVVRVEPA